MIRAIVIDDEKPSREVLCNYLDEFCEEIKVIATASSVKSGHKAITRHSPDLVFLDIELGDGKGFDLLKLFESITFKVIFVTAYSEHAVTAFRFNAVDYLLKPVKIDELKEACGRIRTEQHAGTETENISSLISNYNNPSSRQNTLVIPHLRGFEVLRIKEIIMCKADGYCTHFHLTEKKKIISSKNLKFYEELLMEHDFLRVHHSFIINLNHVSSYTKQGEIVLSEDNRASLGDVYKDSFVSRFMRKQ
ncbi:MAG: LytTR family DNA-binding domain-containing protein [Bacteroidales bacterium]